MADRPLPGWPLGLTAELAAAFLGISPSLFRREWSAGRMPPPIRISPGRQVWHRVSLEAWLDAKAGTRSHPTQTLADPAVDEWDRALDGNRAT
jgi:predicted DNA-binding transcriptional regulator AlpA